MVLFDSSNIIYTSPEEHKCQMTKKDKRKERTVPTQKQKHRIFKLNRKILNTRLNKKLNRLNMFFNDSKHLQDRKVLLPLEMITQRLCFFHRLSLTMARIRKAGLLCMEVHFNKSQVFTFLQCAFYQLCSFSVIKSVGFRNVHKWDEHCIQRSFLKFCFKKASAAVFEKACTFI